jgi:DNA-binding transcriptional MerR regulator
MDIAEVVRRAGVPASTLRYYEDRGLIASSGRRGLRRRFAPAVLDQLALIALGQAAGFSLDEIGTMFAPDGGPRIDRRLLAAKADQIDAMIKRLRAMRNGLRHAAACRAASHAECPSFQRLLRAAAAGAFERRRGQLALQGGRTGKDAPRRRRGPAGAAPAADNPAASAKVAGKTR